MDDNDASGKAAVRGRLGRTVRLLAAPHVPTDPSAFSSSPSSSDAADRNAAAALAGGLTVETASSVASASSLRVTSVPSRPFFATEAHPLTTAAVTAAADGDGDGAASQAVSPSPGLFTVSRADAVYVEGCLAIATDRLKTGLLRLGAAAEPAAANSNEDEIEAGPSDGRQLPSAFGEFAPTYFLPPSTSSPDAAAGGKKGGGKKGGGGSASAVVAAATARLSEWARAPIAEAPAVAPLMGATEEAADGEARDNAAANCDREAGEADAVDEKNEQHNSSADPAALLNSAACVVGLSASEEDLLAAQRDLLLCVPGATGKSMEGGGF